MIQHSQKSGRRRIVIDCDPGQDDMAAIALALSSSELEVLALTTVSGNAPVDCTTRNALDIVAGLRATVPVFQGASRALLHRHDYPTTFHGEGGFGSTGASFPRSPVRAQPLPAHQAIAELIEAHPERLTIVALAPMTNLALALAARPDLAARIEEIVFMGGSTGRGNVTAAAEFNIWADPEAARIVLESGARLTMFGLNVTERAMLDAHKLELIGALHSHGNPVVDAMRFYLDTHQKFTDPTADCAPVHDVCPVAYLLDSRCFDFEARTVEVITERGPAYGMTLVDAREQPTERDTRGRNVRVAMHIDAARVSEMTEHGLHWAAAQCAGAAAPAAAG